MMKNKFLKKTLSVFLLLLITNLPSYAENWVTITAENGKNADLDLDSVKLSIYTVEYNIRISDDDITYINRFSTELYKEGTPTAVISSVVYADGEEIDKEFYKDSDYKILKEGSLQSEIFDVLSKNLPVKNFNQRQTKWTKYLSRQQNTIQNKWKPEKFRKMNKDFVFLDGENPVYISNTTIQTDKNGNVISQTSQDTDDLKITKIECLPQEYNHKTFTLTINKNYYKYKGATKTEKPLVIQTSPDSATVKISKNSRPPVFGHIQYGLLCAIKKLEYIYTGKYLPDFHFIFGLFFVPLGIVTTIGGALACTVVNLLFAITGGDITDAESKKLKHLYLIDNSILYLVLNCKGL